MTRAEVLELLTEWQTAVQDLDQQVEALCMLTDGAGGPIQKAAWATIGMLTRLTALRIGCSEDWLESWWIEDNFGEHPARVRLAGEDWRTVTDIEGLADVICDDSGVPA